MVPKRKDRNGDAPTNQMFGMKTPRANRETAIQGLADRDVGQLMDILGAIPSRKPVDFNAPTPQDQIRFFNVTADQPKAPNIIRGQVLDEQGRYGSNLSLEDLFARSEKDPELARELERYFGPGVNKSFSRRFGRDVDLARLFVDVEGQRGDVGRAKTKGGRGSRGMTQGERFLCGLVPEACQ